MDFSRKYFLKLLEGPAVTVHVGNAERTDGKLASWTLPKALVCHYSTFFSKNAIKTTMLLPTYDPDAFRLFVEWLYHGQFTIENSDTGALLPGIHISIRAWLLGDNIAAPEFSNYAMRQVYRAFTPTAASNYRVSAPITPAIISCICAQAPRRSSLYQYFFNTTSYYWDDPNGSVLTNGDETKSDWNMVWDEHPNFRNNLFYELKTSRQRRWEQLGGLDKYTKPVKERDTPTEPEECPKKKIKLKNEPDT